MKNPMGKTKSLLIQKYGWILKSVAVFASIVNSDDYT